MARTLLIRGARQLLTLHGPSGPRRGAALRELSIIPDGALLVRDGIIEEVGPTRRVENLALARGAEEIDASGKVVMPGFVDSHTHLAYGAPWLDDYEARIGGVNPLDAMTGWVKGMQAIRTLSARRLEAHFRTALDVMARHGTTTLEAKTGYGGHLAAELKILRVLARLDERPLSVSATCFAVAPLLPSGHGRPAAPDLDRLASTLLPTAARRKWARFADVVVEPGAVAQESAKRYLKAAAALGFLTKVHTDQFSRTAGIPMAIACGAVSADHLEYAGEEEVAALARSQTIATLMPAATFHLGGPYAPARALVDAGAAIALATNFDPNTSPTCNMQFVLSLACSQLRLTPAEAISAATVNGAWALRRAECCGSLEIGKFADLIVLNASDYREIPYWFGVNLVRMTVKRGEVVYREGGVGLLAHGPGSATEPRP
jgi:imidazolonepropionase